MKFRIALTAAASLALAACGSSEDASTEAEADTLLMLANDYSVAEVAQLRHVHITTARSQVQALREKTGCARQSTLVKLALGSTARLVPP